MMFTPINFTVLSPEARDARIAAELEQLRHDELFYDCEIPSIRVMTPAALLDAISDDTSDNLSDAAE